MLTTSRSMKALALSLLVFSMPMAQAGITDMATSAYNTSVSATKKAAILAFVASLIYFLSREPEATAPRYNLDEIIDGTITFENIKYLILDGLIGHACKKPSLRVDESGKVIASKGAYPKGIYGHISTYAKPIASGLLFLTALNKFKQDIADGLSAWSNFDLSSALSLPDAKA